MVQTLWDSITDFIAGGDDRTAALQEGIRENVTPFVPPNLREPLGLLAEVNPIQDMYRAGGKMRGGDYVGAGVDTAIAATPLVGGFVGRVGAGQIADTAGDASRAAMDTLLGGAPGRSASAVDTFAERMNQPGPVPTMNAIFPSGASIEDVLNFSRSGDAIYHSGPVSAAEEMQNFGVDPSNAGPWIREVAQGSVDDVDEFLAQNPPAAWWCDAPDWVKAKVSRAAGKPQSDVTIDDIRQHGHLAIASADEYADDAFRIGEEGLIEGEYSHVTSLGGDRMKLYETPLYEHGDDGVSRYPFGIERNEIVTNEAIEPRFTLTGDELVEFLQRQSEPPAQGLLADAAESPAQEVAGRGLLDDEAQGIRAFQGSPHNFAAERLVRMPDGSTQYVVGAPDVLPDVPAGAEVLQDFPMGRMRLDKMGTGEGAQVYGDGVYLAENQDVGRGYRDNVFGSVSSDQIPSDEARQIVNNQLQTFGATPNALEDAISDLRGSLSSAEATNKMFGDAQPRVDASNQAIDFLEQKADTRLMVGDQPVSELYDRISSTADRFPVKQAELEYEKMAILEDLMNDGDVLSVNERAAEGAYNPEAFKWFQEEIDPNFKRQGSLYEVNINANPEDFLDYDAPVSDQPAAVRQNLDKLLDQVRAEDRQFMASQRQLQRQPTDQGPISDEVSAFLDQIDLPYISPKQQAAEDAADAAREAEKIETLLDLKWGQNRSGSGLIAELSNYLNENKSSGLLSEGVPNQTAENVLRQSGVPGVRYFDGLSRNAAEGTRNYVVFDENLIDIVRKYGIAGAAGMLGMTVAELQSQMGQAQAQPQGLLE